MLEYFSSTVRDLIQRRIDGINYAETRRSQLAVIAGALAALGVALLPLSSVTGWQPLRVTYLVAAASLLLAGIVVWVQFARQTNFKYPFVSPAETWKWFYHQALPNASKFGPGVLDLQSDDHKTKQQAEYRRQWDLFRAQAGGLSNKQVDATQDLKQLYLLHVNERYKNLFLTHLREVLVAGLLTSAVLTGATFVAALIWDNPTTGLRNSSSDTIGMLHVSTSWQPTGFVRHAGLSGDDIQLRVELTITNNGQVPKRLTSLIADDSHHRPLPAEFSIRALPTVVKRGNRLTLSGFFWIAAADRAALTTITLR